MAEATHLPQEVLDVVGRRLAPALNLLFQDVESQIVELLETFELWHLDGLVEVPGDEVLVRAYFAGRYHHQIVLNDTPAGFAVSSRGDLPEAWTVTRVAPSPFAKDVDDAIEAVDRLFADATVKVRLLKVRAYLLSAFWLIHDGTPPFQKFYVISCPASFTFVNRGQIFQSIDEFVDALAKQQGTDVLRMGAKKRY